MCCSTVPRMLLPAAQLANIPNLLVLPHTRVLCCRTWNSMQYMNSPYRSACGQIEALYPDRTCLVCYLCSHVLYLLAVHANFSVSGVRISSPDSGPMCTYVGPWPSFWARFWDLVFELCLSFFLEGLQGGYLLGMDLWRPLPGVSCRWLLCLECPFKSGKGFDISPSAWHQTHANPKFLQLLFADRCAA